MIRLEADLSARVARAIDDLIPITVSYIDTRGRPHIAFYGSTHVYTPNQIALWARSPSGELAKTLAQRPHLAAIYGNIKDRIYITFEGRAREAPDESERTKVFDGMHAIEQKFGADRLGVAIIVDLDRVTILSATHGKQVLE